VYTWLAAAKTILTFAQDLPQLATDPFDLLHIHVEPPYESNAYKELSTCARHPPSPILRCGTALVMNGLEVHWGLFSETHCFRSMTPSHLARIRGLNLVRPIPMLTRVFTGRRITRWENLPANITANGRQ
jgi:hypothetical protein